MQDHTHHKAPSHLSRPPRSLSSLTLLAPTLTLTLPAHTLTLTLPAPVPGAAHAKPHHTRRPPPPERPETGLRAERWSLQSSSPPLTLAALVPGAALSALCSQPPSRGRPMQSPITLDNRPPPERPETGLRAERWSLQPSSPPPHAPSPRPGGGPCYIHSRISSTSTTGNSPRS